jgi:mRNA interferase MazF
MKEGNVILTPIPQFNGEIKNRPAIILREMPPCGDFLVGGISTQLQKCEVNFDDVIAPSHTDFASSGLIAKSLIRLGFLAVLPRSKIIGSKGTISRGRHKRLLTTLCNYLSKIESF